MIEMETGLGPMPALALPAQREMAAIPRTLTPQTLNNEAYDRMRTAQSARAPSTAIQAIRDAFKSKVQELRPTAPAPTRPQQPTTPPQTELRKLEQPPPTTPAEAQKVVELSGWTPAPGAPMPTGDELLRLGVDLHNSMANDGYIAPVTINPPLITYDIPTAPVSGLGESVPAVGYQEDQWRMMGS